MEGTGRNRSRSAPRIFARIVAGALLAAPLTACGGVTAYTRPLGVMEAWGDEPVSVAVCRTPADFGASEDFVDMPWYDCYNGSLRRFASSQGSLMCSTRIEVLRRQRVTIEVFYDRRPIEEGWFHSPTRDSVAFAAIHRSDVTSAPGRGLPPGSYRCRFRVGRKVARDRQFTVTRRLRGHRTRSNR
jgi:hypothetical protein